MSKAPNPIWIAAGAAILLLPALVWGRPFVFYDTPVYWGWGHDVLDALARPWPAPGAPWIGGRSLHGWELGAHGATPGDLRFILTAMSARSAFYAVPLYAMTSLGGLWLVAVVQALVVAWTLRAGLAALVPAAGAAGYLALVAGLTVFSGLGFEAGYAMPDVFGGLALFAAAVLLAAPAGVGRWSRAGLAAVIAYAGVAHASNLLICAAVALFALILLARAGWRDALLRAAPVGLALAASAVVGFAGNAVLSGAFGHPLTPAPFLAARVLADGAGQRYLAQVCPAAHMAACDLAAVHADYPEYYLALYPLEPPPAPADALAAYDGLQNRPVTLAEAARREAFVAQEPQLVLGALRVDGPRLAAARLTDSARSFFAVAVASDFDSLAGLMREHTQRSAEIRAITPRAADCVGVSGVCAPLDAGALGALQWLVAWGAFAAVLFALLAKPGAGQPDLRVFMALVLFAAVANALVCGGLSGAYDRYQLRIAWLLPFCAGALALAWAARRHADATLPSSAAPIIATNAKREVSVP